MTYRSFIVLIVLASFAICVGIDLLYFPKTPIFPDEERFLASAHELLATGKFGVGNARAFEMPGTALFLAPFVSLFGVDGAVIPARITQAILLSVQALLIGWMALRIFRDKLAASIAVALTCFYPFLLYYQGLMLSETLFNTLLVAAFASLYAWKAAGLRLDLRLLLTCLLFAAALMIKSTLTLLPPLLIATVALGDRRWVPAMRVLAVSGAVYCALLAPWAARNYMVLGQFVPFTTSSGLNLYLGNNAANLAGGIAWERDVEPERVKTMIAISDEVARNRAFTAAAVEHIAQYPELFVKRIGYKFLRYWNPTPNAESFRSTAFVLISALSFVPILIFAVASVFRNRVLSGTLAPIYVLIAYFTLLHVVVIASLRYRLPLELFLILLASEPVAALLRKLSARNSPPAWALSGSPLSSAFGPAA